MPFTFSHPAIVLPATLLPKRTYSLTGLVIGSITPDFEYFIRMKGLSVYSHTLSGLLWFDIPVGFLLAFIYHSVIRDALFSNLPGVFQTRLSQFSKFDWPEYLKTNLIIVIISLLIGAASHLFWDSFTHGNGYFIQFFPILNHEIMLFGITKPLYNICQHLSTIVGGLVVLCYIFRLPSDRQYKQTFNLYYWIYIAVISLTIFLLRIAFGFYSKSIEQTIVIIIASGLIALTVTSYLFKTKFAPIK